MKKQFARLAAVAAVALLSMFITSQALATTTYIDDHAGSPTFVLMGSPYNIWGSYCQGGWCWQYLQYTGGNGYVKGTWNIFNLPNNITTWWYAYVPDNPDSVLDGTVFYKNGGGTGEFYTIVNQQGHQGEWVYLGTQTTSSCCDEYIGMPNTCVEGGYPCEPTYQVWWDDARVDY